MEGGRNGTRPEIPKEVWEFYFSPECTISKKFGLLHQYVKDPIGKTMKVVESHSKESYTDGFRGYGCQSEYQLMVDYDAFNPNNPKGVKIVQDLIKGNKGEKQHQDHPGDEDWVMYFVHLRERKKYRYPGRSWATYGHIRKR